MSRSPSAALLSWPTALLLVLGPATLVAVAHAAGIPPVLAGVACLGTAIAAVLARRLASDLAGAWCLAIPAVMWMGECASLGLGGQSGRILWVDLWLAAGLTVLLVRRGFVLEILRAPFLAAAVPLVAWAALTLPLARDPLTAMAELKEWCVAGAAGAFAVVWATGPARARRLLGSIALGGALLGLLMAFVAWRDPLGPSAAVLLKRVDLPWGRSNYLAGLLVLTIPLAFGLAGTVIRPIARVGWLAIAAVSATGMALSASKGAVLSVMCGCAVAFLGPWARGASRTTRLALLGAVAAIALAYAAGPLRQALDYRLQSSALDYSGSERMELYRLALDLALGHPLTGVGLNNFSVASHGLHGLDTVPHNFALGFAAELGLPGLVLALAWGALVVRAAFRDARRVEPQARTIALAVLAALLGAALHNQVESTLYGQQFKILLALLLAGGGALGKYPGGTLAIPVGAPSSAVHPAMSRGR